MKKANRSTVTINKTTASSQDKLSNDNQVDNNTEKKKSKKSFDSNAYTFISEAISELPSATQNDPNNIEEKFIKIVTQCRNKTTGQIITEEKFAIRDGIKITPEILELKRQLDGHTYTPPPPKIKTPKKKPKKKLTTKPKKKFVNKNIDLISGDMFASSEDNDPYNDAVIPPQNKRYIKYTEMVKKLKNKKNGNMMRQVYQKTQYTDVPQNPKYPPKEKKFIARKRIFDKPPSPKRFLIKKRTTKVEPFQGSLDIPSDDTFIKTYGSLHAPLKAELDSIPIRPLNYEEEGEDVFPKILLMPTQPVLVKIGKKYYIERVEDGIVTRYRATEDGKRVILVKKDENGNKKIKKKKLKRQKPHDPNLDDTRTITDSKLIDENKSEFTTETKSTFIQPTDVTANGDSSDSFEEAESRSRIDSDYDQKIVVSTVMANSDDLAPHAEIDSEPSIPIDVKPHGSDSVPKSMISGSSGSSDVPMRMTPNMMRRMQNNKKKKELRLPPVPPQVLRTLDENDVEEEQHEPIIDTPKEQKVEKAKRKPIEFKKIPENSEKSSSSNKKQKKKTKENKDENEYSGSSTAKHTATDSSESEEEEENKLLDQLSDSPESDRFYQPSNRKSESSDSYSYTYNSVKISEELISPKPSFNSFNQAKQYSSSSGEEELKKSIANQIPPPKELPVPEFSEADSMRGNVTITQTLTSSSSGAQSFSSGGEVKVISIEMEDVKRASNIKSPKKKAKGKVVLKPNKKRARERKEQPLQIESPRKELKTGGQNTYEFQENSIELALAEPVSMDFTHTSSTSSSPFIAEPIPSPKKEKPIAQVTQSIEFVKSSSSSEPAKLQTPKPQMVLMESFEIALPDQNDSNKDAQKENDDIDNNNESDDNKGNNENKDNGNKDIDNNNENKEDDNKDPTLFAILKESQTRPRVRPRRNDKAAEPAKRRTRERKHIDLNATQVEPPQLSVSAINENYADSLSSLLHTHLNERSKNEETISKNSNLNQVAEEDNETVEPQPIQKRPTPLSKRSRPSRAAPNNTLIKFQQKSPTTSESVQSSESSDDSLKPMPKSLSFGNNSVESLKSIRKNSDMIMSSDSDKEIKEEPSAVVTPAPPLQPSTFNSPEKRPKLTFQSFTEVSQEPTLESPNEKKAEVSPVKNMTKRRKIIIESSSSSSSEIDLKPIPANQIKTPPRKNANNVESPREIPYHIFDNDNISSTDYEDTTTDESTPKRVTNKKSKPKSSPRVDFITISSDDKSDTLIEGIDDVILVPRHQKASPKQYEKSPQKLQQIQEAVPESDEEETSASSEGEYEEEEEDDFYTTITTTMEEESNQTAEEEYSEHKVFDSSDSSRIVIDYSNEGSDNQELNNTLQEFPFSPIEKNREIVSPRGVIPFSPSSLTSDPNSPKNKQKVIWPMDIKKRPPRPRVTFHDDFPKEEPKVEEEYIPKTPSLFLPTTKISSVHKIVPEKKEEKKIVNLKDILQPKKPEKPKNEEEESEDELTIELRKQEEVRHVPKLAVNPEKAKARRAKLSSPKQRSLRRGFIPITETSSIKNNNSDDGELPVAMMQPMVSVRSLEKLQINHVEEPQEEEPIKMKKGKLPKIPKQVRKKIETDVAPKAHSSEIVSQEVESIAPEPVKEKNQKLKKVSSKETYDPRPGIRRRAIILSSDDSSTTTSDEEEEEEDSSTDGAPFSQTHSSKALENSSSSEEESELEVPNTPPKKSTQKQKPVSKSRRSVIVESSSSSDDDIKNQNSSSRRRRRVSESDDDLIPPKPEKKALSVGVPPVQSSTDDSDEQDMHVSAQWGSRISNPSTPREDEETSSTIPSGFDDFLKAKETESPSNKERINSTEALLRPATVEYEYTNSDSPILNAPPEPKQTHKKAPPNPFKSNIRSPPRVDEEEEDEYDSNIPTTIDDTIDERRKAQNAGVQFQIRQRRLLYGGFDYEDERKEKSPPKKPETKRVAAKPVLPFASMLSDSDSDYVSN